MILKDPRPEEVAASAEEQYVALKKMEDSKIESFQKERDTMVALRKTLSAIVYAAGTGYLDVYPQAEGFIEGRIKSLDSIKVKTKNEITEILSQIEENPDINQQEILNRISKIDFKDLFAFSVITTNTPEHFQTGSDEKNEEFVALSSEIKISRKRMTVHNNFIKKNERKRIGLLNTINNLRKQEGLAQTDEEQRSGIEAKKKEILEKMRTASEDEIENLLNAMLQIAQEQTKQDIKRQIDDKTEQLNSVKYNVEYGEGNVERTTSVLKRRLRDLQYKMSEYYVENLAKFSSFKYWGTEAIRTPKRMLKKAFRAVNTGYKATFTTAKKRKKKIQFEVQGKGEIDYIEAEFTAEGAEYHENQKTKDGFISKNIEMPDFTIIGNEKTASIEKEIKTIYGDISTVDDIEEYDPEEAAKLKLYITKISDKIKQEGGSNALTRKKIKQRVFQEVAITKEHIIQKKIDERVEEYIEKLANNPKLFEAIKENEKIKELYNEEREKLKIKYPEMSEEQLDGKARIQLLYRRKEDEIRGYAQTSIPMFFRANLPKSEDENEQIQIYWYSMGESIYRFFANRLNGLKDVNGEYKYKPKKQQKRALLKLTGLFKENTLNFYQYNSKTETLGWMNEEQDDAR